MRKGDGGVATRGPVVGECVEEEQPLVEVQPLVVVDVGVLEEQRQRGERRAGEPLQPVALRESVVSQ